MIQGGGAGVGVSRHFGPKNHTRKSDRSHKDIYFKYPTLHVQFLGLKYWDIHSAHIALGILITFFWRVLGHFGPKKSCKKNCQNS